MDSIQTIRDEIHKFSKKRRKSRHDLSGQYNLLIDIIWKMSEMGFNQLDKTFLYPTSIERSISHKLEENGFDVYSDDQGHIVQIKW